MNIKILTTGENQKEYRLQVKTPSGILHLKIRRDHPVFSTAAEYETWLLGKIGEEIAKAENAPQVSKSVLAGLVGQTVTVTIPASQGTATPYRLP